MVTHNPHVSVLIPHYNGVNLGISRTRNALIQMIPAQSTYIALLDSDDVMAETRLQKQVAYLHSHPRVDMVSSWFAYINEHDVVGAVRTYRSLWEGKNARVLFQPLCAQTCAMIRPNVFASVGVYNEALQGAEDCELWLRMLSSGLTIANIQEVLSFYRVHDRQGTMQHNRHQKNGFRVRWKYLWCGFFSVRGLITTLSIGVLACIPMRVRNTLRRLAIGTEFA